MTTPAQGGTDTPGAVNAAPGVPGTITLIVDVAPREQTREEWIRAQEQQRRERRARARTLLRSFLTLEQQRTMETDDYVDVLGSEGTHYRVEVHDFQDNIRWLDEQGRGQGGFCCHPRTAFDLPLEDLILGQILALRTNEKHFLRKAVKTWGSRPPVALDDEKESESARCGTVGRQAVELLDRLIRQAR